MAQGDDDLRGDDAIYDDEMEDSTMEISLQDIYALSRVDQQTQPVKTTSAPQQPPTSLAPPSPPHHDVSAHEPMTMELDDELIELDDDALDELTSEVFDEEDYDVVQRNFQEVDGQIESTRYPDTSRADDLMNTGVLEHSYEDLFGDNSSLEDDTDPSIDLYIPEISDPSSLSQGDPSEAFSSMEEISQGQFADQMEGSEESWVDSTSVFSPDAALLQAARGAFMGGIQESTEHMIEVPILAMLSDDEPNEDATGMFEVPAALLSQLRQSGQPKPSMTFSSPHEDATIEGSRSALAVAARPFEVDALVNDEGFVVIPSGQPMASHLKPGMRLRLLVQIIPKS